MAFEKETYSTIGPQCPHCDHVVTPDGNQYYDVEKYTEDTCESCGKSFGVKVYRETSWACEAIIPEEGDDA